MILETITTPLMSEQSQTCALSFSHAKGEFLQVTAHTQKLSNYYYPFNSFWYVISYIKLVK